MDTVAAKKWTISRLIEQGVPERAARDITRLARGARWTLTLERAQELAALRPAERHAYASAWGPTPTPKARPKRKPGQQASPAPKGKSPKGAGPESAYAGRTSGPAWDADNAEMAPPRRPAPVFPRTAGRVRPLKELIEDVAIMAERARIVAENDQEDADACPGDPDAEQRSIISQKRFLDLTARYASLTESLKAAEGMGDTVSVESVCEALSKVMAVFRKQIEGAAGQIQTKMTAAGGDAARASAAARDAAREVLDDIMAGLQDKISKMTE